MQNNNQQQGETVDYGPQVDNLESRLLDLQTRFESHNHNGNDSLVVSQDDLFGVVPWYFFQIGSTSTTNATVTTCDTITLPLNGAFIIESHIAGNRTGGSAGTAGDSAGYIRRGVYKRIYGAAPVLVGAVQDGLTSEDQAGWDCTFDISGNDVRVRVTGAANNNITWQAVSKVFTASNN